MSDLKPLSEFTNSLDGSTSVSSNSLNSSSNSNSNTYLTIIFWIMIILVLVFVIFLYLAKDTTFTDEISKIGKLILNVGTTGTHLVTTGTQASINTVIPATKPADEPTHPTLPVSYPQSTNFPPTHIESVPTSSNESDNKSGWCYVGEQQNFRSCIEVGELDTCISGDIFPSHNICVNPSLRA